MKERKSVWDPSTTEFADVFVEFGDFLKIYTNYVTNYDQAHQVIDARKKSKAFAEFLWVRRASILILKDCQQKCNGQDLESLLIMPGT